MRRSDRQRLVQGMGATLDARSLDRLPSEFLANQSGYLFSRSPYAPSNKYESAGYKGEGTYGGGKGAKRGMYYLFKERPDRIAELRAEQTRLAGIQEQSYKAQQADMAKQLKIVQGERSAVSKMQEDYSNMLIAEAQRKKEAEEKAARDLQIQQQTAASNRLIEGRSANLQIQPAGGAPRMGGTSQFRRRALQQGTASPYKGLSTIQSGMVNV